MKVPPLGYKFFQTVIAFVIADLTATFIAGKIHTPGGERHERMAPMTTKQD
jgi:hypothetical protein